MAWDHRAGHDLVNIQPATPIRMIATAALAAPPVSRSAAAAPTVAQATICGQLNRTPRLYE